MPKPSWRKIEAALIDLLRETGFTIHADRGDSYVNVYLTNDEEPTEVHIGNFAKELEKRL